MNLLFTSSGRRKYLLEYFKALPAVSKVVATNSSDACIASFAADRFYRIPFVYEENHLETLLDVCKKEKIDLLFCLHDVESIIISKHIERFLAIKVFPVVSDLRFLKMSMDKYLSYEFLTEHGFRTPMTTPGEFKGNTNLCFPLIVKPRYGFGSQHIFEVHKEAELAPISDYIRDRIDLKLFGALQWDAESPVVYQEKINGIEFGLQILNDFDGNYVGAVQLQKSEMMFGETYGASIVSDPVLEDLAQKLSRESRHIGMMDVDLFKTPEDDFLILELNPRFGGQFPFAHLGGSNILQCLLDLFRTGKCHFQQADIGRSFQKDISIIETGK